MSSSTIQTRRAKEKDEVAEQAKEEAEIEQDAETADTEENMVQVVVQQDQGEGGDVVGHIESKRDSHVQIIASGEPAAKVLKIDNGEEYYVIDQQDSEAMEEEEETSQNDVSTEMDSSKTSSVKKASQKYRKQWEDHPGLKGWLTMMPGNQHRAWCRQCGCALVAQLKVLIEHGRCRKHARRDGRMMIEPPAGGVTTPRKAGTWGRRNSHNQQLDVSYGDADRVTYSIGLGSQKVGFIGAGKIAQAIATGMMNKGLTSSSCILVSSPTDRNQTVWKRWKCKTMHDNNALVRQCDVVFICVSPMDLDAVIGSLEPPADNVERCFISTVSGVSQERLTQMMTDVMPEEPCYVIRCVPSMTVAIGEGICVYSTPSDLPHTWLLTMETMFSALGLCQKVDEQMMNVHSGAFSSGPAYVAAFIDALAMGAANHGIRWEDAVQMAAQVTQGTAAMILTKGVSPATVKRECAASGGNTIAGIMALHKAGMEFAVMSAVDEATRRARELGQEREAVGEQ